MRFFGVIDFVFLRLVGLCFYSAFSKPAPLPVNFTINLYTYELVTCFFM